MKPGAPWSIKGIDPEAREAAKEKARAAGMTLGQWLNSTIVGAGEAAPPVAAAPQPAAGGSALDTARIMRAIAELARRVDVVAAGDPGSGGDNAAVQRQLAALDSRLTEMSASMANSEASMDQARLERGLITIARRVEGLGKSIQQPQAANGGIEALRTEMAQLRQSVEENQSALPAPIVAESPDIDLSGIEHSLARLEGRMDALDDAISQRPETSDPTPAPSVTDHSQQFDDLNVNIRKLMNGMVNLSSKMAQLEAHVDQKMGPVERRVVALQADIEKQRGQDREAMASSIQALDQRMSERQPSSMSRDIEAAIATAMAPLAARFAQEQTAEREPPEQIDHVASPIVADPLTPPEPEIVDDQPPPSRFEPVDPDADAPPQPSPEAEPAAPESEPEPTRTAALNDLTGAASVRAKAMNEDDFFRNFDEREEEQPSPQPAEPEQPPTPTQAPDDRDSGLAPFDQVAREESAREQERNPERPAGLLPVEALLADGDPEQAAAAHAPPPREPEAAPAPTGMAASAGNRPFRLDEPLDLSRQPEPEPARDYPGRRGWVGYLIFALLFLGILVGGFWFVGTQHYRDLSAQVSELWDNAMSGVRGVGADGETEDADRDGGTPTSDEQPVASAPTTNVTDTQPNDSGTSLAVAAPEPAAPEAPSDDGATNATAPTPAPTPEPSAPQTPLEALIARAEGGDADAQFELGIMTRDGVGVEPDYAKAADWFDQAAQQGHVMAQLGLGIMYRQGLGRAQDLDLAKLWLHAAARAGNADAQKYLGEVYVDDGSGAPDYFQAARWFREAAEQGLVDAQYNMGVLYEGGLGVPRDYEQAYYWFNLALQSGDRTAAADLERVAVQLTPEQRAAIEDRSGAFAPASNAPAPALPATGSTSASADEPLTRRDQIRQLQQLLTDRGYDPGIPDGIPGAKTREAIAQWQRDRGQTAAGQITRGVLEALIAGG